VSTLSGFSVASVVKDEMLTSCISWEYPNRQGIGCNALSTQDTPNFLLFLKELRAHPVGKNLILTAAAPIAPWTDPNGNPADISPFAKLLNYIAIMNYDVWGSWSPGVGPNSPLNDSCAPSQYRQGSAVSAIQAWTSVGLPKCQLVLGVGAYGHSYLVNKSVALTKQGEIASYPPFEPVELIGDSADEGPGEVDVCGAQKTYSGVFNFWGLVEGKFLGEKGDALPDIYYRYDGCSQTVRTLSRRSLSTG